jgi:hypothetical protein
MTNNRTPGEDPKVTGQDPEEAQRVIDEINKDLGTDYELLKDDDD